MRRTSAFLFLLLVSALASAREAHEYSDAELEAAGWSEQQIDKLRQRVKSNVSSSKDDDRIIVHSYCAYFDGHNPGSIYPFDAANQVEDAIDKVMSITGLPRNFEVIAAGVPNASALIWKGKRVIAYSQTFLHDIENEIGSDWPAYSIMAHEIGHHLAGHTLADSGVDRHRAELEADKYSGFAMQRLGASLEQAQLVMRSVSNEAGSETHPPRRDRLAAIANGWLNECDRDSNCSAATKPQTNTTSEVSQLEESKLYVNTEPAAAAVKIVGSDSEYRPGIVLLQGETYRLVVEKEGYERYDKWLTLTESNVSIDVSLKPKVGLKKPVGKRSASAPGPSRNFRNCQDAVQNNVAWNYAGTRYWNMSSLHQLCGDLTTTEPAICFDTAMHRGVNWGRGVHWQWQNAVNLCARTTNAKSTITCFMDRIQSGRNWQVAINSCKSY